MSNTELRFESGVPVNLEPAACAVPLAAALDFECEDYDLAMQPLQPWEADAFVYQNVATCPECSGAMLRQGRCGVCPSCGFECCLI